jgi:hypothetical protein
MTTPQKDYGPSWHRLATTSACELLSAKPRGAAFFAHDVTLSGTQVVKTLGRNGSLINARNPLDPPNEGHGLSVLCGG